MRKLLFFVAILISFSLSSQVVRREDVPTERSERDSIERKNHEAKRLVNNAVKHFKRVPLEVSCRDFIYNSLWRKGELFVFVTDEKGKCLAQGDNEEILWTDFSDIKITPELSLLQYLLSSNPKGAVKNYDWNNALKTSYVRIVKKNGTRYILGSGFFPRSKKYTAQQLVSKAASSISRKGATATFDLISNPRGPFIYGDIYLFVLDLKGMCYADGTNPALIGQNLINNVDARGVHHIQNIVKLAKKRGKGWTTYHFYNALKFTYIRTVADPKTKKTYIIGGGFYPGQDLQTLQNMVKKGISYMKTNGSKAAFNAFSDINGSFVEGGIALFVYDLKGKSLADGENPQFVGQNLINRTSQGGKYFVRNIVNIAKKYGKGTTSYRSKNAYTVTYFELVNISDGKFIVGGKFYPSNKSKLLESLVVHGTKYLQNNNFASACNKFSQLDGGFIRGDLHIFVYDNKGTRYANGMSKGQIWRNFIDTKDQAGTAVVKQLITTAVNGGGWVDYVTRNAKRRAYVQAINKKVSGKKGTYIVGSGYFV